MYHKFIKLSLLILYAVCTSEAFLGVLFSQLNNRCGEGEFSCLNGRCIASSNRCNGHNDCFDNSDEEDCDAFLCKSPMFFKCKNNGCISHMFVCDGENDCLDFSDEINCDANKTTTQPPQNCTSDEWQCTDKQCIPKSYVCDSNFNCADHSDEVIGCSMNIVCDGFKCKDGHCIPHEWQCDGAPDCPDKSDETDCMSHMQPEQCTIDKGYFLCKNNHTCIKESEVCDGKPQCPDKSDESALCSAKNTCETFKCPHQCVVLPSGPKCVCPAGYVGTDGKVCQDVNECDTYGICDHKCRNTEGSYECYCDRNYKLQDDKKTCRAQGGEAMLLFSFKSEIRGYFLDSKLYFPIAKNLRQAIGVAFDGHHVYWTDIFQDHESIVRSLEDGSERELLVTSGLGAPEDIAVDWLAGNFYFTDADMQHIGVCTNDGTHCTVIVNKDIHKPRGIVLDPRKGQMYWSDWGKRPEIGRANMDGSEDISFVSNNINWPNGLTIDYPNERLYWTDAKQLTIQSVHLDGTDRRVVLEGIVKHPYGVAVFEDRLYWSDWNTHSVESCDKFTGKNHTVVVRETQNDVYGVHVFHSALRPKIDNPCAVAFCSHICLLRRDGYTCACPEDKVLGLDKHTCRETTRKQLLVLGTENHLYHIHHQKLGKHDISLLPYSPRQIGCLTYNSINNSLLISDLQTKRIIAFSLNDGNTAELVVGELGQVISMDFDYLGNNLYWCDSTRETVEIYNFNTNSRKVLIHDLAGEIPLSIALVPEEGIMFVAFKKHSGNECHIDRLRMDGTGRTHTVDTGLSGPVTLVYDKELNQIFWADAGTNLIERTSIEGDNNRHMFRVLQSSPITLASLNKDIFWINKNSQKLFWADKKSDTSAKKISLDIPDQVEKLHLTSVTPTRIPSHACHLNNGNCSHLCLLSLKDRVCACPLGMTLKRDNLTCTKPLQCERNQFLCRKTDTCVPIEMRCNGKKDCLLGEDEENCTKIALCPKGFFQCRNGECIKSSLVCDLHYDCVDRSDEISCRNHTLSKCPEGRYQCSNGRCISERFVCDGKGDCDDGDDETGCDSASCRPDQFRCLSGFCVPKNWECDRDYDCPDMSDEHSNCAQSSCDDSKFTCISGRCIDHKLVCDGSDDCGDMSDEYECNRPATCNPNEFQCKGNTTCLPISARCNGTSECPHNEDEHDCSRCQADEFECRSKHCIPNTWICDHTDDCGDNSDERPELCNHAVGGVPNSRELCEHGFRCKNGDCVSMAVVCNGREDCSDGSDEGGACEASCSADRYPCMHLCLKTPAGPVCKCRDGYRLRGDGRSCEDVEECRFDPPVCSQVCWEQLGAFTCDCFRGFVLRSDRTSCKAEGKPMKMLFTSENQIRQLTKQDNNLDVIYSEDTPKITGLDVDTRSGHLFFSIEETGTIHRMNLINGSRHFINRVGQPRQLALDWISQNVYFVNAESSKRSIHVCNFYFERCAKLKDLDVHMLVTSISVDAVNKYLFYILTNFWVFNSPNYVLYRSNLDGTDVRELVKSSTGYVSGLTYDFRKKLLYYTEQYKGELFRVTYDGSDQRKLMSNLTRPKGLNLFEDQLYFLSPHGHMQRCSLYGEIVCDDFKLQDYTNQLFVISQESRQPKGENVCDGHKCTYMCIPSEVEVRCVCQNGSVVREEEVCESMERSVEGEDRKPQFKEHLTKTSSKSGSVSAVLLGIFIPLLFLLLAVAYYVLKRRRTGNFNVSIRFSNPSYGLQTDEQPKQLLQPGQHEYCNPLDENESNNSRLKEEGQTLLC